jgi:hypothetical protein
MSFKAVPLDMINEINYFSTMEQWEIVGNQAVDLWFQLRIVDGMGERRYMTQANDTIEVVFQRADRIETLGARRVLTNTDQNVTKPATPHADDASLFKIALTSQDVQNIVSGTMKFTLTEDATSKVSQWLQNWAINKKLTEPGC